MKKYNGDNKIVKALIEEYSGEVYKYRYLPSPAKESLFHYMAEDGEAWPETGLHYAIKHHAEEEFGLVDVPAETLKDAVIAAGVRNDEFPFTNWQDYHKWYIANNNIIDHGESVWPVIFSPFNDELFQDGWHRFHSYVAKGLKVIPCLYYVK